MLADPSVPYRLRRHRVADQGGRVERRREVERREDAHDREPALAQPDGDVDPRDAEPLRGRRPQHDGRVPGGRPVEEDALGDRPVQRLEEGEVRGEDGDAAGLALGDQVGAPHGRVHGAHGRDRLDGPQPPDHPGGVERQARGLAAEGLPGRHGQQVGPEAVDRGQEVRAAGLGDRQHGDHRGDADGDADRRQHGPDAPAPDADEPDGREVARVEPARLDAVSPRPRPGRRAASPVTRRPPGRRCRGRSGRRGSRPAAAGARPGRGRG